MDKNRKMYKTNEQWKKELTPEQYRVTREKGTEMPYIGKYWATFEEGIYKCSNCGAELFPSRTKYDAHCGWPSFYDPVNKENVELSPDSSHGMQRTEVTCSRCGAHLGHVFDDEAQRTGKYYCINSVALKLQKK